MINAWSESEFIFCFGKSKRTIPRLGAMPTLYTLQNKQRFDATKWSGDSVVQYSDLTYVYLNTLSARIITNTIARNELRDDIAFLQLGQSEEHSFITSQLSPLLTSATNEWPIYKIVGLTTQIDSNLIINNRSTYDLLSFYGDLGGFEAALEAIGAFLVGTYATFNAYAYLISHLYVQNNSAFQTMRHQMKSQFESEDEAERPDSIFYRFIKSSLKKNISQDFFTRAGIDQPTAFNLLTGCLCRTRAFKRYMKLHRIGKEKVDTDLDVITMVRQLRVTQIELWSLLSRNQHKFANKLGEYVLSEFSSSSGDSEGKTQTKRWGMKMFSDNKDTEQFIEAVVDNNTAVNRKLVNI